MFGGTLTASFMSSVFNSRGRSSLRARGIVRLPVAAALALGALVGCGGSAVSPSTQPSATAVRPSVVPSATPSLAASPTSAPHFVPTGSMQVARLYATATLLANGKVLITGGMPCLDVSGARGFASAELYDPKTGTFATTGALTVPRDWTVATLLKDGRVLVVGGDDPGTGGCTTPYKGPSTISHRTADIYDPRTGQFTRVGSPLTSYPVTATLLPDGRVVTADGDSGAIETFDPTTGKFTPSGSLPRYEPDLHSTLLPDGRVLFLGLVSMSGPRAEIYDPESRKTSSLTLQLPAGATEVAKVASGPVTATTLDDGRILLCIFDYLEIYDPSTGSFTAAGSVAAPGKWLMATATLLSDGDVLFAGGTDVEIDVNTNQAGIYDPASGFHQIGSMTTARDLQTATLLPDGTVLIAGGTSDEFNALSSAELFVP
jgi:WD40 repeat protein